ncbi:hypothetical protein FGIG_02252 [Fasciola gigantica]|uniref:Uncharacterized protein n=1 Tax=Fasciola gigantica TaxID=46835 RepID=A0A504YG80_FASGI|nr:hypothetical protein FGIG_02252 [Fasciola gigantica]
MEGSMNSLSAPDLERYSRDADNSEETIQSYREQIRMLEKKLTKNASLTDDTKAVDVLHTGHKNCGEAIGAKPFILPDGTLNKGEISVDP